MLGYRYIPSPHRVLRATPGNSHSDRRILAPTPARRPCVCLVCLTWRYRYQQHNRQRCCRTACLLDRQLQG